MTTRILLADSQDIVRMGLRALLEDEPDLEVVAEARDGAEAVRATDDFEPDLVIIDAWMPRMNGIEAARRILSEHAALKVLCLAMPNGSRSVEAMLQSGASGYLLKDAPRDEVLRAVRTVIAGKTYLSPAVERSVVKLLRKNGKHATRSAFAVLTNREREVLQWLAEGYAVKAIAQRLGVSAKTVSSHREHIMMKLRIRSIAGLTKYAIQEGLIAIDSGAPN